MKLFQWLRDWTLIIAILTGIVGYFAGVALPVSDSIKRNILSAVELVQPVLIFFMLFSYICKNQSSRYPSLPMACMAFGRAGRFVRASWIGSCIAPPQRIAHRFGRRDDMSDMPHGHGCRRNHS